MRWDRSRRTLRVTHHVAAAVLSYPDESLMAGLPLLRQATGELPSRLADPLLAVLSFLDTTPLSTVAAHYVDTFDLRRRCCLYLTYYTHGDTRRRGQALLEFRQVYQSVGLLPTGEELPDHLAVVLELSAAGHPSLAVDLLTAHRPGLVLLGEALRRLDSPYAHAINAVLASLPAPRPDELRAAARQLAEQGPPAERVGITVSTMDGQPT